MREYDTNLSFTFMVNNQYDAVEMFDGWMDFIGQEDTSSFLSPYASYRTSYETITEQTFTLPSLRRMLMKSLKGERPRELRYTMVGVLFQHNQCKLVTGTKITCYNTVFT